MRAGKSPERQRRLLGAPLAALLCGTVALAPGGSEATEGKRAKQKRPNIVVIMDDDQSAEQQRFLTKTNALIGRHGVTFDNSFVNNPVCCPSRATFLTGQYAHNHGVRFNKPPSGGYSKLAPSLTNSLPVWLERAGYYTGHIGKFVNGYGAATSPPTEVPPGWNEWYGSLDHPVGYSGGTYTAYGYILNENGRIVQYGSTEAVDSAAYQTDVYSQKAADFIRRRAPGRTPFFLSVAPRDPHVEDGPAGNNPRAAPRYEGMLAGISAPRNPDFNEADVSDKLSRIRNLSQLTSTEVDEIDARYRARAEALLGVDDLVQNVVATLKAKGELRNTLIIFTSDNGYFHGEHRVPTEKNLLYEPSIRVPLLIRAPGTPRGVHRPQPVYNVDLAPTILDFAGAKAGRKLDGISLRSIVRSRLDWRGRGLALETFDRLGGCWPVACEGSGGDEAVQIDRGVRTDRYLYYEYRSGEQELYDLRTDPFELQNAIASPAYASVKASLQKLLVALANCAGKRCRARPALKLKLRDCSNAVVVGDGAPQQAAFHLRGRRIGRDTRPPLTTRLRHASAGARLHAVVTALDGRMVTLKRKLPRC